MSNEEVVLKMVLNRLQQLLEGSEEFKSKWGAEITEIIMLGSGVLVSSGLFERNPQDEWLLPLNQDKIDLLSDILNQAAVEGYAGHPELEPLRAQVNDLFDQAINQELTRREPDDDDDGSDDDGDDDDPLMASIESQVNVMLPPTFHPAIENYEEAIARWRQDLTNPERI